MSTHIVVVGAAGRMGRMLCDLVAESGGYTLDAAVDDAGKVPALQAALGCLVGGDLEDILPQANEAAVLIDFTAPEVSLRSARLAAAMGHAIVIGTTGFSAAQKAELEQLAARTPVFWSSNMSIGVSVLRRVLPQIVRALGADYDMEIMEIHHRHKKDAPSGTALALGQALAGARGWKLEDVRCSGRDGLPGERPQRQIGIQALRGGDVVGVHTVYFLGPGERIELSHHAHSRSTFAQGALRAAAWLSVQGPGRLYGMDDVI